MAVSKHSVRSENVVQGAEQVGNVIDNLQDTVFVSYTRRRSQGRHAKEKRVAARHSVVGKIAREFGANAATWRFIGCQSVSRPEMAGMSSSMALVGIEQPPVDTVESCL